MEAEYMTNFLTDEDLKLIESRARIDSFKPDTKIISRHNENTGIYWVRKGIVRVELSRMYQDIVIAGIGPGEIFGEISFLMNDHKTTSSVIAHDDVEVMFIDRETLDALLEENDGLAARFFKTAAITLAQRLRSQTENG